MKHILLSFIIFSFTTVLYGQSEYIQDQPERIISDGYKEFGEFLLDMSLMNISIQQTPKVDYNQLAYNKDFTKIFSLNPDITYSTGIASTFSSSISSSGFFNHSSHLQMGSFKLKNGMKVNTYGDYNSKGYRVMNPSALPWERNNFRGAFELKSANGNFGIRVEVQQGRNNPF